jgi:hypothetical protein
LTPDFWHYHQSGLYLPPTCLPLQNSRLRQQRWLLSALCSLCTGNRSLIKRWVDERVSVITTTDIIQAMHEGVIRDMEQQRIKRERQLDFEMQRQLEEEYRKVQHVSDGRNS